MRVDIREGGDGVRCWNRDAIMAYAEKIGAVEAEISAANPDVRVAEGQVRCYGCEVQEYHYGTKCTAALTRTLYAVRGQIGPRTDDAAGFLSEIDGLLPTQPGSTGLGSHNAPVAEPTPAATASGGERRVAEEPPDREPRKKRGLFGR